MPTGSGRRQREILAHVTAHPGVSVAELADALDASLNVITTALPGLVSRGLIRCQVVPEPRTRRKRCYPVTP
jgi:predicted ArsR family transcriptional regulator